jgi:hypothetical protein
MTAVVFRLFESYAAAESAVRDLEAKGVDRDAVSVIASNADGWFTDQGTLNKSDQTHGTKTDDHAGATAGAGIGAALGGSAGLFAGLGLLAIPGVGPIVAGGWLAAALAGAATGGAAGGLIGALTDNGVSTEEASVFIEGVRRGGTLVTVRVPESDQSRIAAILDLSAINIAERGAAYRKSGWTGIDQMALPGG